MSYAIRVENVGKRYDINRSSAPLTTSIRDKLSAGLRFLAGGKPDGPVDLETPPPSQLKEFWALKDISFDVGEGERIGIIGANGAGKSTLLKILSRITAPTEGQVSIRGKVASLLEVGTGFHPDLSGRENIFLNGAILGMSRAEIRTKFDKIVDFSGVGKFIDTPVKQYSSGMYVRLAFSVSAWLDPDILIVDEVLSVGDASFQRKCAERLKEMTREGRTVLFVSHSMATVNETCHKALYLNKGRVASFLPVEQATVEYQRSVISEAEQGPWHRAQVTMPNEHVVMHCDRPGLAEFLSAQVSSSHEGVTPVLPLDQDIHLTMTYRLARPLDRPPVPAFHIYDEFGARLMIAMPETLPTNAPGIWSATCTLPAFQLNIGRFCIMPALSLYDPAATVLFAGENALRFELFEPDNADPRRHGWRGPLPGTSRARLPWVYGAG